MLPNIPPPDRFQELAKAFSTTATAGGFTISDMLMATASLCAYAARELGIPQLALQKMMVQIYNLTPEKEKISPPEPAHLSP